LERHRVLERRYSSDVEVRNDVGDNIRNSSRRGVLEKLFFLAFGLNIFRVCLLYAFGW